MHFIHETTKQISNYLLCTAFLVVLLVQSLHAFTHFEQPGKITSKQNTSENAVAYRWDFGTGAISTESAPVYLFPSCGTYKVTLTIRDKNGHTEAVEQTVFVLCTKPAHVPDPTTGSRN